MYRLPTNEIAFPDPALYDGNEGLLAYGGDVSAERLLFAYSNGIFPWYNPGEEILWWCPDPRFVLFPERLKVSKSMRKILRDGTFTFSIDTCFEEVMRGCMHSERRGQDGTWISKELIEGFVQLHQAGYAKSIEVWRGDELVGGLYGMQIGNVFCGESMFARVSNASKAGFIWFVQQNAARFQLIDCQTHTSHLESLGAEMIPKQEFLSILRSKTRP